MLYISCTWTRQLLCIGYCTNTGICAILGTEGKALGDYCAIPKVSKERRYPYSCNNLFRLWLEVALSLRVTITNSYFLIELHSVCVTLK